MDWKYKDISFKIALIIALLVTFGFLYWLIGRNINFDDEGFYMLPYTTGQEFAVLPIQQFSYLIKFFVPESWITVYSMRFLRLILTLFSGLLLGYSTYQFLKAKGENVKNSVVLLVAIICFSSFVFGPLALSYNSFNFICICLILSGILFSYSHHKHLVWIVLSGFFTVLAYYSKFTTGILLFGALVVFILVVNEPIRDKKKRMMFYLIGLILATLSFHFIYPIQKVLSDGLALSKFSESGYDIWSQLQKPYDFILDTYIYLLIGFGLSILHYFFKNQWIIVGLAVLTTVAIYLYDWTYVSYTKGLVIYMSFIGMIAIPFVQHLKELNKRSTQVFLPILLILFAIAGIFGTNNFWAVALTVYATLILMVSIYYAHKARLYALIVFIICIAFVNTLYFSYQPYRSPKPLMAKNEVDIENLGSIKISNEHLKKWEQFSEIVKENEVSKNSYLGILWKYPMINYLLDIPSPAGVIWSPEQKKIIEYNYRNRSDQQKKVHWIVISDTTLNKPASEVIEITHDELFKEINHYIFEHQHWYYVGK